MNIEHRTSIPTEEPLGEARTAHMRGCCLHLMTTAVLREHRKRCKRSHVIEFKKNHWATSGVQRAHQTGGINCKENKAWRCFFACFRLKLASRSPHAYTSFMCSCSAFFWEMEETKCSSAFEESCFLAPWYSRSWLAFGQRGSLFPFPALLERYHRQSLSGSPAGRASCGT